ncbi:succinylglutamate desuccinylase/aspartoacylase family protein [Streptomyces sp. B21-105]|uniref:succinylglutamate desuccinylase/aspartoacylase domain-containing protein n=1 Tax=Streptomyces sp. B21-105 TaxID=3039417 RepID=UPI002FF2579E
MTAQAADGLALAGELDIPVHDFTPPDPALGRSVYLQGQLHANESAAMLVLHELVRRLRSAAPANQVRVVPNANPVGWSRYLTSGATGQGRISAGGINWNRMFTDPRQQGGAVDASLASTLWRLSDTYDVIIDVHTPEFGWPHLYATSADRRLVTLDDIPHVMYGDPTPGAFDECHLRLRAHGDGAVRTSVTLEIPSHELPTDALVSHWSDRLMREIDAQSKDLDAQGAPQFSGTMTDLVPRISGAVVLHCRPGEPLSAGLPILTVRGRKGESETLIAPSDCVPVCFRRATVVEAGYWACRAISLH